jgi:AraC family transcriptional regulator of adaptative response/methylated-DNA-[protein]-cysteine methyltransferase
MNSTVTHSGRAYERIARAIHYLDTHRREQPGLAELGAHLGLSESHLQREFSAWAGVSPKQFLQYLTKESAKRRLRDESVMQAALESGLSGSGRLHDLMINCEGMTPGEYRARGRGLVIRYGIHPSPFGDCFLAMTERGVCKLAFVDAEVQRDEVKRSLHNEWEAAVIECDQDATAHIARQVFDPAATGSLRLLLRGSSFQLRAWEALLSIPEGRLASYQQVAILVDRPSAIRSVASAIARNDIGYLIPCHRVIRSTGEFGQYRWGSERKQALIGWEAARYGDGRA